MRKRDQIPVLYWIVRGYDADGNTIKSVECRGVTKEDAAKAMGDALQHILHCKGVARAQEYWAGQERQTQ